MAICHETNLSGNKHTCEVEAWIVATVGNVVSIREYLMNLSKELHSKIESKVTTSIYQVQNLLVCAVQ